MQLSIFYFGVNKKTSILKLVTLIKVGTNCCVLLWRHAYEYN